MRRHFARRIGAMLVFFFLFVVVVSTFVQLIVSEAIGAEAQRGGLALITVIFGLLTVGWVSVMVIRAVRRMARPIGEVMEAAERVAAGDYGVRVDEHGWRETRRLARSFNAMTERLGSSEEQRRNLLADLAHELRTPLSVIQGNIEGMLDGLYAVDRNRLEPLLDETKVMSRLLEDLETLSGAEAGALRLHREPAHPEQLVEDALVAFRPEADAAGVTLEQKVAPGLPRLDVDPVRISQVLSNLVSNALQHSSHGSSVVIGAERDGEGVAFTVRDNGPGIDPELLPHVFDRFVKAADSGGAGLGLAIARSLVEAHGGEITAESEPAKGTTMRFALPVRGDVGTGS